MNDYMTLLHKHKINGGFLAPDRIPMEERNKNEMILELQNEVHTKDQEIERLNKRIEDLNIINEEHQLLNGMIRNQLQQKENIIKEVREYIKENTTSYYANTEETIEGYELVCEPSELLEILEKEVS